MNTANFDNRVGPRSPSTHLASVLSLLSPVLILVGALQIATQTFAATLQHAQSLGSHYWFVYPPWSIVLWYHRFANTYPEALDDAASFGIGVCSIGIVGAFLVRASLSNTDPYLHGSARWANRKDLEQAGLLPRHRRLPAAWRRRSAGPPSVIVGAWRDRRGRVHYLTHSGPEHVLVKAPTRSGKGVGLVIPTLLTWQASALVIDLKGELYALTAGWRHLYAQQTVLRLNFTSQRNSVHWNPLEEIRMGTEHEVGDAQNLALMLVDGDGKGIEADHWRSTSWGLLVGAILHLLQRRQPEQGYPCLADVSRFLADPARPTEDLWQEMIEVGHPVAAAEAAKMQDRPDEEAGSVLSTAQRCLALFLDPVVAETTRNSDFGIKDLMQSERPVTLYVEPTPADKDRLRPLLRIFVSMALRTLAEPMTFERGAPKKSYKHRLLLMLDEFIAALQRLPVLQDSLAYLAGYGVKAYLICQNQQQLESTDYGYGRDETVSANSHVVVALRPNTLASAKALSENIGLTTVRHTQVTHNGSKIFGSKSKTVQYTQRPLLTPDECLTLPGPKVVGDKIVEPGEMLVMVAGIPAARGPQPLYFQDPVFSARAAVPPPLLPLAQAKTAQ